MSTSYDSQANSGAATLSPQAGTVEIGHVAQVNARNTADDAGPDNAAAVQAVQAAIAAANPLANGVNFGPFSALVVPTAGNFVDIKDVYDSDTYVGFYQYQGTVSSPWLPLGDIIAVGSTPLSTGVMVFAPGSDPNAFMNPTDFSQIVSAGGGLDGAEIAYWQPIPPAGYVALGICFTNGAAPDLNNYWCVSESYVMRVGSSLFWSDSGTGWSDDGTLLAPAFTASAPEIAPPGGILILPPTVGSSPAGFAAYALVGSQGTLAVTPIPTPGPVYVDGITEYGDTTECGLRGTLIFVPYTAVPADSVYQQALVSPFYYVASEPYWQCTMIQPTPTGGTFTVQESVGLSQTNASSFAQTTSMTVGAEFGAAYGGVSVGASVSMTEELRLETSTSTTGNSEVVTTVSLNFPEQEITSVWQSQSLIQVFRSDGTPLAAVPYENGSNNVRFAPSGMTPQRLALQAALARG